MWYDYIGPEQCGWRLIRKGTAFLGVYNYVNHKKELLFSEWLEYAESFIENKQCALILRPGDSEYKLINTQGVIVGVKAFEF